jgi:predicted amidohydrolase
LRACWRYSGIGTHKTYLSAEEQTLFWSRPGPRAIDLDGWRIGLGICRNTGVDEHVHETARLGLDLYACGVVHHAWELAEQQHRARDIAATCRAPVAMASFAGLSCEPVRKGPHGISARTMKGLVSASTGLALSRPHRASLPSRRAIRLPFDLVVGQRIRCPFANRPGCAVFNSGA